jgi:hypothetical protein
LDGVNARVVRRDQTVILQAVPDQGVVGIRISQSDIGLLGAPAEARERLADVAGRIDTRVKPAADTSRR